MLDWETFSERLGDISNRVVALEKKTGAIIADHDTVIFLVDDLRNDIFSDNPNVGPNLQKSVEIMNFLTLLLKYDAQIKLGESSNLDNIKNAREILLKNPKIRELYIKIKKAAGGISLLIDGGARSPSDEVFAIADFRRKARLSKEQQEENAEYIYKYLKKKGWSNEAIAAVLGNMEKESGMNPGVWSRENIEQRESGGYGLFQSTPANEKFLEWTDLDHDSANDMAEKNPHGLIDIQIEYMIMASQPGYGEWFGGDKAKKNYGAPYNMTFADFIVSENDVGDLAMVFYSHYERSEGADGTPRKPLAEEWLRFIKGLSKARSRVVIGVAQ